MRRLAPLAGLLLAGCPDGLSAFTLSCLPPEACPAGASCLCPDGGEAGTTSGGSSSRGSSAAAGTSGSSSSSGGSSGSATSSGHSSASSSSPAGSSSGGSGGSSSGGSSSSGSSSGGSSGVDAGNCAASLPGTPVVLATPTSTVAGLFASGGVLYFTEYSSAMELFSIDVDGGTPVLLGSIPMSTGVEIFGSNVVADATHVYWTTDLTGLAAGNVDAVQVDGGGQTAVASAQSGPVSPVVDATNLYWAEVGGTDGGSIWKLPLAGGPAVELASAASPYVLALDATSVYWTTASDGVQRVAIDVGAVSKLASVDLAAAGVAVDANNVYFGFDSYIEAVSLTNQSVTVLASNQTYPQGIVLDGTTLYWTNSGTGTLDGGSLMKLPLGCPTPIQLAASQQSPSPPAVDSTSVYWVAGTYPSFQILKLQK